MTLIYHAQNNSHSYQIYKNEHLLVATGWAGATTRQTATLSIACDGLTTRLSSKGSSMQPTLLLACTAGCGACRVNAQNCLLLMPC